MKNLDGQTNPANVTTLFKQAMGVYKEVRQTASLMQMFGVPSDEIIETFFSMSPDPFHSAGFISFQTGLDKDVVAQILREDSRFIRLDALVWTTEEKLKLYPELDSFEKLV